MSEGKPITELKFTTVDEFKALVAGLPTEPRSEGGCHLVRKDGHIRCEGSCHRSGYACTLIVLEDEPLTVRCQCVPNTR